MKAVSYIKPSIRYRPCSLSRTETKSFQNCCHNARREGVVMSVRRTSLVQNVRSWPLPPIMINITTGSGGFRRPRPAGTRCTPMHRAQFF